MVPVSVFSCSAKKYGVMGARHASAAMPTITAVPPARMASTICSVVCSPPMASNA